MTKRVKVTVLGLAALVGAASVVFVALAQTDSGIAASPRERLLAKVAVNLGVSSEDLVAAFTGARLEMIDEAVAAGQLTEEQAQAMKARMEARQALRGVFADALAEGRITHDQLALLRGGRAEIASRPGPLPRVRALAGRMRERMLDRKCP